MERQVEHAELRPGEQEADVLVAHVAFDRRERTRIRPLETPVGSIEQIEVGLQRRLAPVDGGDEPGNLVELADQQRRLKLRPEVVRDYDLDLRKPNDLARSRLLYRLAVLDVPWGKTQQGRTRNIGTFRESWQLTWRPELDLGLLEPPAPTKNSKSA